VLLQLWTQISEYSSKWKLFMGMIDSLLEKVAEHQGNQVYAYATMFLIGQDSRPTDYSSRARQFDQ
jgi:hypothetical protein